MLLTERTWWDAVRIWVYFRLLDIVADTFKLNKPPADSLIAETADGFGLMLKSGKYIAIEGVYNSPARRLNVKFSYNRTYVRDGTDPERNYPAGGSWTRQMRPDYTLTLWTEGFSEEEAEIQKLIVHVHFDAKYKVEDLTRLFGDDSGLDEEKEEQRQGIYKRADLLKMHAYRDAIRRTAGAYVLYPGTEIRK